MPNGLKVALAAATLLVTPIAAQAQYCDRCNEEQRQMDESYRYEQQHPVIPPQWSYPTYDSQPSQFVPYNQQLMPGITPYGYSRW